MKILFYCRGEESLGVESLAAVLKQAGHSVDLLFDPGIDNTFYYQARFLRFLQNKDAFIEKAKRFSPDLLAFSSITNDYPYISEMISKLKKILKVPVIVGGVHATAVPEFVMEHPGVDMVCRGEGEEAFLELVGRMSAGKDYYHTRNIWFKKEKGVIKKNILRPLIKNLDTLPFPDKDLFYKYGCFKGILMEKSGRGCPFSCTYCHNCLDHKLYQGDLLYRRRSVDYLISLLSYYKKKYRIKSINFEEDLFVIDKEWLRKFSYYYAKEIALPFYCFIHPNLLDKERASLLRKAGCEEAFVGVESGNKALRKQIMKRKTPKAKIRETVSLLKKNKIKILVSAVFGWPQETPENMWETVKFCNQLSPNFVETFMLYPYPGTEVLNYCRKQGLVGSGELLNIYRGEGSNVGDMIFNHPHKNLAYVMAKLAPVYAQVPFFLKPLIKIFMHPYMKNGANLIYLFFLILWYPRKSYLKLKQLILMTKKSYFNKYGA
ncbi:MAG: B12-binding domain-containing radical SAM protein [Candidatus Omnitrophica bacterium]|nr:B12-binding domain-containing radical SAM protein [Candidatus Omnitrophota bacterium]